MTTRDRQSADHRRSSDIGTFCMLFIPAVNTCSLVLLLGLAGGTTSDFVFLQVQQHAYFPVVCLAVLLSSCNRGAHTRAYY